MTRTRPFMPKLMTLHPPRLVLRTLLPLVALLLTTMANAAAGGGGPVEPNIQAALGWWPDLTDYWTPVGWKHHRFRYNVFFDGTIYADPGLSQTAAAWNGQGVQIRVQPTASENIQAYERLRAERYALEDDRRTRQGWTSDRAPVLWTEWSRDGLLLREDIFAHTPGGREVKDGLEPLFAWVRLSIHDIPPGLPVPKHYTFCLQLNAPHVRASMAVRHNIIMLPEKARYPRPLRADNSEYNKADGLRVLEPDGKVRLALAPGAEVEARLLEGTAAKDPLIYIKIAAQKGNFVDLLVPMIPTERAIADRELMQGYAGAKREADTFWSHRPSTAATIDVPEPYINETLRQFERFAEVLSERDPESGRNVTLSGSLAYVKIWATPTGKMVSMFLDPLGYHDLAGEFLEPFILAQGTRKPPSPHLQSHPGYLGSPEQFKSIDWMADHGSLLFAIANHALQGTDLAQKARYADVVVKAAEFIRDARRTKGHAGVEGILPPARYSDRAALAQGVWNDGWNYKGLVTGARLLRQIRHPRANEFAAEAEDYRRTFLAAFRKATASAPTWTDARGQAHPMVPTSLHGSVDDGMRHGFYLDTGPLMLVFAGLMSADDPIMQSALAWFREGPPQQLARFGWNHSQVPFLRHEMSSCIPGYSWNVFHNHQLGDRQHYLEAMYSQYAGAISQQTRTVCESRGGITGRITHADTPFYMTRLAVVDDVVTDGELHLLRICPLAWISAERTTLFENMPTAYGPISLRWQLSPDGRSLNIDYTPRFHEVPHRVVLHAPPVPGLQQLVLNGKVQPVAPGQQLTLPSPPQR